MDLTPLIPHRFALDDIRDAYDVFSRQGDGVMKVALFPSPKVVDVRLPWW